MPFNDRPVALITGASRGIGMAIAESFAVAGYRLALSDIDESALDSIIRNLPDSIGLPGDLSDMAFVESLVPSVSAAFGRLDVLVNNAAWREIGSMRGVSIASWDQTLRICLTAPAFMARWAAEVMERQGGGVIINIGSVMSRQAAGISPAYIASKGGLEALTLELASLYGPVGIRVVCISPGAIDTELSRDVSQSEKSDSISQFSEEMIMLRRWGRPEEVAATVLFVASDSASYLTGTTITLDGGWSRQHLPLSLKKEHYPGDY